MTKPTTRKPRATKAHPIVADLNKAMANAKPAAVLSEADKRQLQDEAQSRGAVTTSVADAYTAMSRSELEVEAGNYDLEIDADMTDDHVRDAIRAADAAIDTSADDEFEAGMAEELAQRAAAKAQAEGNINEAEHPMLAGKMATAGPAALVVHNEALPKAGLAGNCPHCGKTTRNGKNVTEYAEMSPGSQNSTIQQFTCNQCAGEWGPVVDKPKRARAPSGTSNGLKIEANREERNGVKRPSVGGKCRGIWDELDAQWSVTGKLPTGKEARDALLPKGFDKTTIMVQYYRWRKFMGIEGRQ